MFNTVLTAAPILLYGLFEQKKGIKQIEKDRIDILNSSISIQEELADIQRQINDAYAGNQRQITNYQTPTTSGNNFDYLQKDLTIDDTKKTAYLPRSVWFPLSVSDKNALLADIASDGYQLLIND
jgi:hypothetical protein